MKNMLFVATTGGFVPQFEMNDVRILREYGFCIHYAANFDNPVYRLDQEELARNEIILHQIPIEKSPLRLGVNWKAIRMLRRLIDEEKIDLIHCHNPMGGVAARLAARMSRRKPYVIYTAHGFHFYDGAPVQNWLLYYTAERFLARYTDQIITINREDCCRAKSFPLKKGGAVTQIPGVGVDAERFQKRPELRETVRGELGIPEHGFHIVTVAELNENKNQRVMIEAIAALRDPDIYYSICGGGPNERALRELIAARHLEGQVHLLGYRSDTELVLQSADCFAFPSIREGLGMAAIEALCCEVPVIALDNRGTREYMQDGVNGIVCKANSASEFAQAIKTLKEDAQLRQTLGRNGRESVLAGFSMEKTEQRMRQVYQLAVESLGD